MSKRLAGSLLKDPVHLIALGFGAGLLPRAPGTAGTVLAIAPAWLMQTLPGPVHLGLVAGLFALGVWVCGESARRLGHRDHPAIVFDEVVGYLATCLVLPSHPLGYLLAFVLFRFFDIAKPWPIRDLDHRLHGGLGIMLDDLVAALYAAVCILLVYRVFPFAYGAG